jgi:Family of unknown function (DUF6492)
MEKYTIVTIAYQQDSGFMRLQARSIARYVAPDIIGAIIVVENTPAPRDGWRAQMLREYGHFADLVKFVPAATIATIPATASGWFSQQVLKLMVATIVQTKRYLILDAKNHFISPLTADIIEAKGKPRSFVYSYHTHPLRHYLESILDFYALPRQHVERFLPTTPPFYVDTKLVCAVIEDFKQRTKNPSFETAFLQSKFTEFFMIGSYILSTQRKFEDIYDLSGSGGIVLWKEIGANDAEIARALRANSKSPYFSLHRATIPLLSATSKDSIAKFWHQHGLFDTELAAHRYLVDPNAN